MEEQRAGNECSSPITTQTESPRLKRSESESFQSRRLLAVCDHSGGEADDSQHEDKQVEWNLLAKCHARDAQALAGQSSIATLAFQARAGVTSFTGTRLLSYSSR